MPHGSGPVWVNRHRSMRQDLEVAMRLHRCRSAVGFGVLVLSQRVAF